MKTAWLVGFRYEWLLEFIAKSEFIITLLSIFSVHCFNGGWLEGEMTAQRKKTQEAYEAVLKRMAGK